MFLYRLQEKKFYFINFLLYVLKIVQITLKRQSENYSFSIYNKKSGKKLIFNFGFLLERKRQNYMYNIR